MAKENKLNREEPVGTLEVTPAPDGHFSDEENEVKENGIEAKIKSTFANFPFVDKLWHDEQEVYFLETRTGMTVVHRNNY